MPTRKLYRSESNRVFAGVLGGLGEYFGVDATLLRVFFVIGTLLTGFFPLVLAYIIIIFIVPQKSRA